MYIQRHGESEANLKRVYSGLKYDPPLTGNGRKQIESYLEYYAALDINTIISSPSIRAIETAEIIADHLGLPISVDKALHEIDMGTLEGEPQDDPANTKRYSTVIDNWLSGDGSLRFEDGESWYDVKRRIDHVTENYLDNNKLLLVAHATFFACLMGQQLKYDRSVFEIFLPHAGRGKYVNGKWELIDKRQ